MKRIIDYLLAYKKRNISPFHMPGHKRNTSRDYLAKLGADIDFTEIEGLDDLHEPKGIIADSLEGAKRVFGAKDVFYLVNGSTSGNLSGIRALTKAKDKVLVARNSHKSIYNAVEILDLDPVFIYPKITPMGFATSIDPKEVEDKIRKNPEIKAIIITSPTYEGVISDIASIGEIAHKNGISLFVDEAHGAHLGMNLGFEKSAIDLGADLVVKSMHKTLSSLTSTAVLLSNTSKLSREDIQRQVDIFDTSSPSYLLISSLDACICEIEEDGRATFNKWLSLLEEYREKFSSLVSFNLFSDKDIVNNLDIFKYDKSKLLFYLNDEAKEKIGDGKYFKKILLDKKIEVEMASLDYIIAMTGMGETRENLENLYRALKELDREIMSDIGIRKIKSNDKKTIGLFNKRTKKIGINQALNSSYEYKELSKSIGRIAAEYIWAYPPGIPMIIPGEVIDEPLIEEIKKYKEASIDLYDYRGSLKEEVKILID